MKSIVYAVRLKDKKGLINSSSGGMFTAISDFFINRGDMVVCSTYNYDLNENEFKLISTKQGRDKARGSKYIQSKMKDIFHESIKWIRENPDKELLFGKRQIFLRIS